MRVDQAVDRSGHPGGEVVVRVVPDPHVAGQIVEPGVAGRLEFLDRDVGGRVPVELGDVVDDRRRQVETSREGLRRLEGAAERARVDGVDALGAELLGEQFRLPVARLGEFRIGGTGRQLFPLRESVSYEDEFHWC